jgi:hypothetical protein
MTKLIVSFRNFANAPKYVKSVNVKIRYLMGNKPVYTRIHCNNPNVYSKKTVYDLLRVYYLFLRHFHGNVQFFHVLTQVAALCLKFCHLKNKYVTEFAGLTLQRKGLRRDKRTNGVNEWK